MSVITENFRLHYSNTFQDVVGRHSLNQVETNVNLTDGQSSLSFNGTNSYVEILNNPQDFSLGSTPVTTSISNINWIHAVDNNSFTIDVWVYPIFNLASRYFPICSSFSKKWYPLGVGSSYYIGWSFQIDCVTGKLQMINYSKGNVVVFESNKTVKTNEWTHVVVTAWRTPDLYSNKSFYINGIFDSGSYRTDLHNIASTKRYCNWSNCLGYLSYRLNATGYAVEHINETINGNINQFNIVGQNSNSLTYSKYNRQLHNTYSRIGIYTGNDNTVGNPRGAVIEKGYITNSSWDWIPGTHLYIDYTNGQLSAEVPSSGPYTNSVALAMSPTKVWFFPGWAQGNYERVDKTDVGKALNRKLNFCDVVYTYSGSDNKYNSFEFYDSSHSILKIGIVSESEGISAAVTQFVGSVLLSGEVYNPAWNFDINRILYINDMGELTQDRPISTAPVKSVGYSLSRNRIWFFYGWSTSRVVNIDANLSVGNIVYKKSSNGSFFPFKQERSYYQVGIISEKISNTIYVVTTDGNIYNNNWNLIAGKNVYLNTLTGGLTQDSSVSHKLLIGSAYGLKQIWLSSSFKEDNYSKTFIGVGPKHHYFQSNIPDNEEFELQEGYFYRGLIKKLRFCEGNRFPVEGNRFDTSTIDYSLPQSSTSTTTSTVTTTATTSKPVEVIPFYVEPHDLLSIRLQNYTFDYSGRHNILNSEKLDITSVDGVYTFSFNNSGFCKSINNLNDFMLGATLSNYIETERFSFGDNKFTIDMWIYPIPVNGQRYLGICSSFGSRFFPFTEGTLSDTYYPHYPLSKSDYKIGWSLQLDTETGRLQMIGYEDGLYSKSFLQSSFIVPFNQWSHIALISWEEAGSYPKRFFLNGIPDTASHNPILQKYPDNNQAYVDSDMTWGNGLSKLCVVDINNNHPTQDSFAYFYLGASPKSRFTDNNLPDSDHFNIYNSYKFNGNLRNFRISEIDRFNHFGFNVPDNFISTTTSTVTTTVTTQTTTTVGFTTFTTTVNPVVKLSGQPIASSSQFGNPAINAFDNNPDTVWKPVTAENSWVGISFIPDSSTSTTPYPGS